MTSQELFLKSNDAKIVEKFLDGVPFHLATDAAMLKYMEITCSGANDPATASANHFRLEGARNFLAVLRKICSHDKPEPKQPIGQLKQL